ncbi:methionine gamma-lyase [Halobacillus seohaensis]|uniref:L-methionine gamma-lyase n=1 Tax=Halobacillus seohaensis TaxID=447421 RepID=A0ABW2ESB4_9BACI
MNYREDTKYIHGGTKDNSHHGSLSTPIFQTSTFSFETAIEGERRFSGEEKGYIYSRLSNPTVNVLEERIAAVEGGERGLAFASGMAAISAVLTSLTKTGDQILCANGIYGCTYGLLELLEEKYGITHDFCDMSSVEKLRSMIKPQTACIFIESPINPTMKVIDIAMVSKVAREYQIPVIVDNTFLSPYLQQPLSLGSDIVVHSATKYLSGHGDVIGGLVVGKKSFIEKLVLRVQKDMGGIMSPFDAWLLIRGMKTLPIRMKRHSSSAEKIVEKLKQHSMVKEVLYPNDLTHPDRTIAQRQMSMGGGIISFRLTGGKEDVMSMMDSLNLVKIAVSLGDAETLIQYPATMTHAVIPESKRIKMGIDDSLLRLSVGLEEWEDIWLDLEQSLNRLTKI